jgi:proton-dependent oligopeptide transporter, POT family
VGVYAGSKIAGYVYGHYGEKAVLALRYLAERTAWGQARHWDGQVATLETVLDVTRTQAMAKLVEITGLDQSAATRLLWDTYSPQIYVWIPFALVGVLAAVALWAFGRQARRWSDMNA